MHIFVQNNARLHPKPSVKPNPKGTVVSIVLVNNFSFQNLMSQNSKINTYMMYKQKSSISNYKGILQISGFRKQDFNLTPQLPDINTEGKSLNTTEEDMYVLAPENKTANLFLNSHLDNNTEYNIITL